MVAGMPQPLRVIGDRLGVVAGRHRDHAARALGGAQRRELGERAALLERVGDLQVLVFDEHLRAGERGEFRRRQHRRAQHLARRWCAAPPRCRRASPSRDASSCRCVCPTPPSHRHEFLLASSCRLRNHFVQGPTMRESAARRSDNGAQREDLHAEKLGRPSGGRWRSSASARRRAQDYPTRPVKIFIAFPVGGLLDTVSRIVGEKLAACSASSSSSRRAPAPAARSRRSRSPRPIPTATR